MADSTYQKDFDFSAHRSHVPKHKDANECSLSSDDSALDTMTREIHMQLGT